MTAFSRHATVHMDTQTDSLPSKVLHCGINLVRSRSMLRCLTAACTAASVIGCALLAMTLLLVPRPAHATGGQCIWEGGPGASQYPECKLEDCLGVGGVAQCTDPEIRPPNNLTDAQVDGQKFGYITYSESEYENIDWCLAAGGTYNGFNAGYSGLQECAGLDTNTYPGSNPYDSNSESAATSITASALALRYSNCAITLQSDTGWSSTTFPQVGGTYPYIRNGKHLTDAREQVFSLGGNCSSSVTIGYLRLRQLTCPVSFTARTVSGGDLGCFIPAEVCCTVGNPVSPVTGGKLEAVIDYQMGGGTGLQFGHTYNSQGRYRVPGGGPFISGSADYWRFTYERHLVPINNNPQLTAIVQREDGTVEEFDGSGNEILNRTGAADRLTAKAGGGWTLKLANQDTETYDPIGNFTTYTTRAGVVTTVTYGSNGRMSRVVDSFGDTLTFGYNTGNQLTSVTLPDGTSTISYAYDSFGRLMTVAYADQTSVTYEYEDQGNAWLLTGITDESGQRYASYVYSPQGILTHEEHAGGVASYNFGVGGISYQTEINTSVTDPLGQSRSYIFDNYNGVFKLRYSTPFCPDCPNVQQSSYDGNGNIQWKTDLDGSTTSYVYDSVLNLETSRTENLGGGQSRTTSTQWHPTFRLPALVSIYNGTSASGTPVRTTAYTYDGYGNLLTTTLSDGATGASRTTTNSYYNSGLYGQLQTTDGPRTDVSDLTTYTYYNCNTGGSCGHIQTITDALGHTTTYNSYDANGLPLVVTDPNGVTTSMTYDLRQRILTRTVGGEQTTFTYYPTGLLKKVVTPDGAYLSYVYDAAHRLIEVDDSMGDREIYTLDGAGNRQKEQAYDPSGGLASIRLRLYNSLGELWQDLTSSQSSTQATVYTYDSAGNQLAVAAPLGRNTTNSYDGAHRLIQVTDPAGGAVWYSFDSVDNLTSVTDSRQLKTTYTYNGLGDLSRIQSPDSGTVQDTYDSGGNLQVATDARGSAATYTHDALNRTTQVTYADHTVHLAYDQGTNGIGHLGTMTDASGQTVFHYDTEGRVIQKTATVGSTAMSVSYTYQNALLTAMITPSGQTVSYTYNANGQLSSISINSNPLLSAIQYVPFGPVSGWTWGNGTQTSRAFDVDGQLTEIDSAGKSVFTFLDDGSISSRSDDADDSYSVVPGTATFAISPTSNQIQSASGTLTRTYNYDASGNTLGLGSMSFSYNTAGRMISATNGNQTTAFTVNGLGQRVSKTSSAGTTLFAYDESHHLIGEYSGAGALIEETIWLGDIPVAVLTPNGSSGVNVYYIHVDHLNTPRRITRPSDNAIVWRWLSDPFGVGFVDPDPDGDGQLFTYNQRLPGQYFDPETSITYNYMRDYDAPTGRYLESDPLGLQGGINTYAYAEDNPEAFTDPLGLKTTVTVRCGKLPASMGGFSGGRHCEVVVECSLNGERLAMGIGGGGNGIWQRLFGGKTPPRYTEKANPKPDPGVNEYTATCGPERPCSCDTMNCFKAKQGANTPPPYYALWRNSNTYAHHLLGQCGCSLPAKPSGAVAW